jgi:iron complex outermembrane receptor protein
MKVTSSSWNTVLVCLTAAIALPYSASAAAPASPTAADSAQLEEVIVTARRVEERLQDIPASVYAITGDDAARMVSLADIQSKVSGVTFQTIGPIPVVGIRGFGNRSQAGNPSNSAVGIFQDGVFVVPTLSTVINRTDTERVEIAKGPQSTLYGRSSFTGAFNIVTADPADHFSGYVDAGFGSSSVNGDNHWRAQGAVSIPLADSFSIRLYGLGEKRDGYIRDAITGNRSAGYDRQIGRLRVLWKPTDAITARLTGTFLRDDIPLPLVTAGRVRAPLGQAVIFANPGSAAARAALQFSNTVWDASLLTPQQSKVKGEQVTLDLRFRTPIGELASLSDYQNATLDPFFSLDLTKLNWANGSGTYYEKRYSQELRVSNKLDRLSYLFGLYFLNSKVEQGGGKAVDLAQPFARFGAGALLFDNLGRNALYQPAYTETNSYAAFAQVGYAINDRLDLNLGLRYGRDKFSGPAGTFFRTIAGILIPAPPFTARSAEFNSTTGSAGLSYHITPDAIAYGSYARGNSPGGLNAGAFASRNFGPQDVDAFEIGLKSQLLDHRLQLNLALFDNQYRGLQLVQNALVNAALVSAVSNAAKAKGSGFDMDAMAIVSKNWRIGLQYTYVDSKITQYTVPTPPFQQVDLTGVPLVRSPENSLNASLTFSHDIGPGKFRITAAESYTSSYTNDYLGVPTGTSYAGIPGSVPAGVTTSQVLGLFRTNGYALTNLDANYSWDKFQVGASVRNLLNKQYIAAVLAFGLDTVPLESPGAPRTYELSFKVNF